jgi:hypothetical protein
VHYPEPDVFEYVTIYRCVDGGELRAPLPETGASGSHDAAEVKARGDSTVGKGKRGADAIDKEWKVRDRAQ